MTNEDYSKVPPPYLLKKFSEQARVDSQKRGHPGYCKTFAKLCIDWAFREIAMDDLRVASAEASGVELNSRWGADQELEACCEWLNREGWSGESRQLRAARRPKPPSLKELAIAELDDAVMRGDCITVSDAVPIIRRALEQLDD